MKVLFATDGSDAAINAGLLLERLGDAARVEVTVMSVTHAGVPAPEHLPLMLDPLVSRREDTLAIVDFAVAKLQATGFRAGGQVAEGHPGQEIVRAVEQDWYDIVLMGSGNKGWLGARLLGSVSTFVLHSSPWSVLIVHDAPYGENEKGRVLVGADGSRGAEFTIKTLARFADPGRTELSVASVVPLTSPMLFPAPGPSSISPEAFRQNEEVEKHLRIQAERHSESAATELRDAGFEVEAHVSLGSPTEQILEEAEGGRFDLVAVGSRGMGPFRRALLGSVSDHVVRHSRAALVGRRLLS